MVNRDILVCFLDILLIDGFIDGLFDMVYVLCLPRIQMNDLTLLPLNILM